MKNELPTKKEPIIQYIEDMKTINEKRDATNEELAEIKKRYAPKRRDFYEELKSTGKIPVPTKKEIKEIRADRRVRDYMLGKNKKSEGQFEKIVSNLHKKKEPTSPVEIDWDMPQMKTAKLWSKVRDSSLYKLLDNPQVLGVELSNEAIISIIDLLQSSGFLKDGGRVK
jgi:hypothetical protein